MLRIASLLFLLAAGAFGAKAHAQRSVSLKQLLDEVRAESPSLAAARQRITAAKQAWNASGKPADPMLSVEVDEIGLMRGAAAPMVTYMLEQPVPIFGTLGLQERVAARTRERTEADLTTLQRDLEAQTARAYAMLWRAEGELAVLDRQRQLLSDLAATALARMASGADTHHDVLQSQVEALVLQNQQTRIAAERTGAVAMLDALRNRSSSEDLTALATLPELNPLATPAELEKQALGQRPELRSMSAMSQEERAMAALMRREGWPMFSVGAFYNQDLEMADSVGFVVRGTLPVFGASRQSSRAAELDARAAAVESERAAMESMIRAELRSVLATYRAAEERVALLRDVALPRADQALAQARSSYRTAMMPFASVIQDQRMVTELQMELIAAQAARFEAQITLVRALGRDLTSTVQP